MTYQRIELHEAIESSRGAAAGVWEYSASLSELTIRVTWKSNTGNMHFVCNGCTRIEASAAWGSVDFKIQQFESDRWVLSDHKAKFFVECGSIRVFRNVPPLFNETFDR